MLNGPLEQLLAERPVEHARWGLGRIRAMLAALGNPERSYRSYHIAGTNGKGTAAYIAASVLREAGRKVGLYTSPHLVHVSERVFVDGSRLEDATLERLAARVLPAADATGATYFEALTALAFLAFADAAVDIAVVEVGLGGRLDATNTVHAAASAITSIGLDHEAILGGSLAAIAVEKAGIVKRDVPVAVGPLPLPALDAVLAVAHRVGARVYALGVDAAVGDIAVHATGTGFRYEGLTAAGSLPLHTSATGRHQAINAGVALLMLEAGGDAPEPAVVQRGVEAARIPGRFEVVDLPNGRWILDVAHNVDGVGALATTIGDVGPARPIVALIAILQDKAWSDMLRAVAGFADAIILTVGASAPAERRWDTALAAQRLLARSPHMTVVVEPDFDAALARARELAGDGTVVVTGSTYTVGDAATRLRPTD